MLDKKYPLISTRYCFREETKAGTLLNTSNKKKVSTRTYSCTVASTKHTLTVLVILSLSVLHADSIFFAMKYNKFE